MSLTGTLNFSHGLLVCLPRTHPAAQLAVGGSALAPPHSLTLAAGAPALGCTQHHTLSHYSTLRRVGVATVAAGAGAAEADEQHQAGWSFVASCSAAAGSMEQFRWTGTRVRRGGGRTGSAV